MRRYDHPPIQGQYYQHRPGAYGIFYHARGLLLTAQLTRKRGEEGVEWQLPGGGIEKGESPHEALTREALEETGWRVHVERKLGAYRRYVYMPDYQIHAEKICHIYLGRAIFRLGEPSETDHFPEFFAPEIAAKILVNQGDRDWINRLYRGRF